MLIRYGVVALSLCSLSLPLLAQEKEDSAAAKKPFQFEGYAIVNYYKYWWQTDPSRRANMDLERVAVEPSYRLNDRIKIEGEVEFEHGGSGATMEFDKIEEFGEYEQEVEHGGEVVIEKLVAEISFADEFNLRIGHFYVPVGLVNQEYEPNDYFTVNRSEAEVSIIPAVWHESGIGAFGRVGPMNYQVAVVNGLDATGFSSASWIVLGQQGRFEMVNAENLAYTGRLDFDLPAGVRAGVSGYYGNSADNRPKPDLTVPANVGIVDVHGVIENGPLTARALVLYGTLQNAGAVSIANRNLSNNLNVKRTPVGSAALGWFVEAGYDLLSFFRHTSAEDAPKLDLFARYEYYDTQYRVPEGFFDNPRWERSIWTAGLDYHLHPNLVLKSQFSTRTLGLATANIENTFSAGLGIEL